jgi:hypothetical protein
MKQKKISVTHISYAVSKQTSSFRIHTELAKTINSIIFVAAKSIKSDLIIQPTSVFEKISSKINSDIYNVEELLVLYYFHYDSKINKILILSFENISD